MEKFERLNYQVLSDAFVRNGCKKYHLFVASDCWGKVVVKDFCGGKIGVVEAVYSVVSICARRLWAIAE